MRVESLRRYLEFDPQNLSLHIDLCDALLDSGQSEAAMTSAQAGLALHRDDAGLLYRLAVSERRLGNFSGARIALDQLIDAGVQAQAVLFELAGVLMQLQEPALAAAQYERVVQDENHQNQFPDADFLLLRTLHQSGQVDAAITHAQKMIDTGTTDARVLGALGTLYLDANRFEEAGRLLTSHANQLSSDLTAPVQAELQSVGGFVALNNEDLVLAISHFEASLNCNGQFGRSLLGLGLARAASGDLPTAQHLLQQTVQAMPTHIGSWHALAWIQIAQDQFDAAEASFTAALELDRNFGDSYGGLALIAALHGDHTKARELCKVGYRLNKRSMNVVAAQLVMQHGSLKSPALVEAAQPFLASRPGFKNTSMQETLARFVAKKH